MTNRLSLCLCGLLLTGCISYGNPNLADDALMAKIKAGETTKDQVATLLGEPSHRRSSMSVGDRPGDAREWWSYSYSSSVVNPLKYVLLYGLFINGIGTPDTRRELDIFYSPEGVVATVSHVTTDYDLNGPYMSSKVTSTTKIEIHPSGFGDPVRFEDKVGYRD